MNKQNNLKNTIYCTMVLALAATGCSIQTSSNGWIRKELPDEKASVKWNVRDKGMKRRVIDFSINRTIETSWERLLAVLKDVSLHHKINNDKESRILKTISGNEWLIYYYTKFPWIMTDFEIVAKMSYEQESAEKVVIKIKADSETPLSEERDAYRNTEYQAVYTVSKLDDGLVQINLDSNCMPPIKAPLWILNRFYYQIPMGRIQNLLKLAAATD